MEEKKWREEEVEVLRYVQCMKEFPRSEYWSIKARTLIAGINNGNQKSKSSPKE